jgi:hypothetical protein
MDSQTHFVIVRVGDGENFKKSSPHGCYGVKRGSGGAIKTRVYELKKGSILCFMTSKKYGGKIIGMAEFCGAYDRQDEPLLQINTMSNEELGWEGNEDWDIEIHYKNLYDTEKQNIKCCISNGGLFFDYEKFKDELKCDLPTHYKNFKFYAEVKSFIKLFNNR